MKSNRWRFPRNKFFYYKAYHTSNAPSRSRTRSNWVAIINYFRINLKCPGRSAIKVSSFWKLISAWYWTTTKSWMYKQENKSGHQGLNTKDVAQLREAEGDYRLFNRATKLQNVSEKILGHPKFPLFSYFLVSLKSRHRTKIWAGLALFAKNGFLKERDLSTIW